jgi:modulator of FtsH protease
MEYAYSPEDWQVFYGTVAGASAALTGLLFVALSVNLAIVRDTAHRARAREALSCLLILVVLAMIVLIPRQGQRALGWELLVAGIVLEVFGLRLQTETLIGLPAARRPHWMVRLVPLHLATLAVPIAGASLLLGRYGGLLWLVLTVLVYILWSIGNAWALIVQAASE